MGDDTTVYKNIENMIQRSDRIFNLRINETNNAISNNVTQLKSLIDGNKEHLVKTESTIDTLQKYVDESKSSLYKTIDSKERDLKESDEKLRVEIRSMADMASTDRKRLEAKIVEDEGIVVREIGRVDSEIEKTAKITAMNELEGRFKRDLEAQNLRMDSLKNQDEVNRNQLEDQIKKIEGSTYVKFYNLDEEMKRTVKKTAMNEMEGRVTLKIRDAEGKLSVKLEEYASQVATLSQQLETSNSDLRSVNERFDTMKRVLIYTAIGIGTMIVIIVIIASIIIMRRMKAPTASTHTLNGHIETVF